MDDWAHVQDYTRTVSKFILTDVTNKNSSARISPAAFLRLALSQEPEVPFFPSLSELVIVDADASLPYLELLVSPSLTSLEVQFIPHAYHPTIFSFLITLAQKGPLLRTFSFSPGQFSSNSLHTILQQFTHLCHLDLRDLSEMTFHFFKILGSLPMLESLVLDVRSSSYEYISSTMSEGTSKSIGEHKTSPLFQMNHLTLSDTPLDVILMDGKSNEDDARDIPLPPSPASVTKVDAFNQLVKLHMIGPSLLVLEDLIPQITSAKLKDVSFTVAYLPREELEIMLAEKKAVQEPKQVDQGEGGRQEAVKMVLREEPKIERPKLKVGVKKKTIPNQEDRLRKLEGESDEERWLRALNEQKREREEAEKRMANAYNDNSFVALLRLLSSRWSTSLKTVSISPLCRSPQHSPTPPIIPKEAFQSLLFHPTIENLIVEDWTVDCAEDSILGLSAPSNLKSLFLPLDETNSGVSLSALRHVALTCPKLEIFQCRIKALSLIPEYTAPTTEILFHGLRTLSVGNSPLHPDSKKLYLIARHLDLLFPHLERIASSGRNDGDQWIVVDELVKMCQTARMDERYRTSITSTSTRFTTQVY